MPVLSPVRWIALLLLVALSRSDGPPGVRASSAARWEPRWERVVASGRASWPDAWTAGGFPLAVKPLVGHDGALWMVHALGVWHSTDGVSWERRATSVPWGDRSGVAVVAFHGAIWALGGAAGSARSDEIWRSADGVKWTAVAAGGHWSPRTGHAALVYRDALWLLGGNDGADRNDVWRSADGLSWQLVTRDAGWSPRSGHAVLAWRDGLWLVGGSTWQTARTDTWSSVDGVTWDRQSSAAPWSARMYPGVVAAGDRLWLFGGSELARGDGWTNDVWWTLDGRSWRSTDSSAPWTPRTGQYSVLFHDRIWMYGGKGLQPRGATGFADDVWMMSL